jgi:hypothetical protein
MTFTGAKRCKHVFSACAYMTEAAGRPTRMAMVDVLNDPSLTWVGTCRGPRTAGRTWFYEAVGSASIDEILTAAKTSSGGC